MKMFNGLAGAENYAINSSKKHDATRYVTRATLLNTGIVYYVYEKREDIDSGEKVISTFKNGEKI